MPSRISPAAIFVSHTSRVLVVLFRRRDRLGRDPFGDMFQTSGRCHEVLPLPLSPGRFITPCLKNRISSLTPRPPKRVLPKSRYPRKFSPPQGKASFTPCLISPFKRNNDSSIGNRTPADTRPRLASQRCLPPRLRGRGSGQRPRARRTIGSLRRPASCQRRPPTRHFTLGFL